MELIETDSQGELCRYADINLIELQRGTGMEITKRHNSCSNSQIRLFQ